MYSKIQSERVKGYSKDATARRLRLSWRTIDRYWDMTPEQYLELSKSHHQCTLDKHENVIKSWLERFPSVKYVKYNFARNRYFRDIDQWTQDCFGWLERTGNGKVHDVTKKIPAEVFALEKLHLQPVLPTIHMDVYESMISTPVLKNNTIRYKASRYSIPIGTYTRCKTALVREQDGHLEVYDSDRKLLAVHSLSAGPGGLIRNNNHARNTSEGIITLLDEARAKLGENPDTYLSMTPEEFNEKTLWVVR